MSAMTLQQLPRFSKDLIHNRNNSEKAASEKHLDRQLGLLNNSKRHHIKCLGKFYMRTFYMHLKAPSMCVRMYNVSNNLQHLQEYRESLNQDDLHPAFSRQRPLPAATCKDRHRPTLCVTVNLYH